MRNTDKKFLISALLTTVIAIIGYMFLSWQVHNYTKSIEPTAFGSIFEAPFIVIGLFLQYWWMIYSVVMLGLFLRWVIKWMAR